MTQEGIEQWQTLVGSSGFSAVYPVVHTMAVAQRWPQLTSRVYLASLEFTFGEVNELMQGLDLMLNVDEKRKGWFWYSFDARMEDTIYFTGSAVLSNYQGINPPQSIPPSPAAEKICSLCPDEQCVTQYLEISGDPNPIHRKGNGNTEALYPGLLLLGQVETALRNHLNISLAANYATKAKFYSPVFVGEAVNVAFVSGVNARFEIAASNRVAATISCQPF